MSYRLQAERASGFYMGHNNLNSLKGLIQGIIFLSIIGFIKTDTRSLEYGSHGGLFGVLVVKITVYWGL